MKRKVRPVQRSILFVLALAPGAAALGADEPTRPGTIPEREYRVGVEDQLSVVVWKEPELSRSVRVRPDGKITLPLVNDVTVEGRTPDEVRQILVEQFTRYFPDPPSVTVIVEQINSFRVYFVGEVNTQGAIQFYSPIRLLQAIATAGGPTEFANRKEIMLLREEFGVERRIDIDYKKLLARDPAQENIFLKPGDTLVFK